VAHPPRPAIHAVLFDVGGPLDTELNHERLMDADIREALAAEGFTPTEAEYADASRWAVESFASNTYAAIIWKLTAGDAATAGRAYAQVASRSMDRHAARGGPEIRPGIPELLAALEARGLVLGLAANQPAAVIEWLDARGIGRYFSHRQVGGHHGYHKPDVRLFLAACADLGVEPQDCVMVGDRIDNDIAPARTLGMLTILFRTGRHIAQQPRTWLELPHAEVGDVQELGTALDGLLSGTP
jgi:HAD superfamily hydrolase (TIGR01509 family)